MLLNEIPAPRRNFDPNKPNPNAVVLTSHTLRPAKLSKISKMFYEKNVGTDDKPRYVEARADEPGAIPRTRITVTFKNVKNLDGAPLVLSSKFTMSTHPKSNLAKLVAGLRGITPEQVAGSNIDTDSLLDSDVLVMTKDGSRNRAAVLTSIIAAPRDDDEQPVSAAAPAPPSHDEDTSFDEEEIPF